MPEAPYGATIRMTRVWRIPRGLRLAFVAATGILLIVAAVAGVLGHSATPATGAASAQRTPGALTWLSRLTSNDNYEDNIVVTADRLAGVAYAATQGVDDKGRADILVAAYDATTGDRRWLRHIDPTPRKSSDETPTAIALDPFGHRLAVAGTSSHDWETSDWLTTVMDTQTGAPLWTKSYDGPLHQSAFAGAITFDPSGRDVFVGGWADTKEETCWSSTSDSSSSSWPCNLTSGVTAAYDAGTGALRWRDVEPSSIGSAGVTSLAVAPDGKHIFTGGWANTTFDDEVISSWSSEWCCIGGGGDAYRLNALGADEGKHLWNTSYHREDEQTVNDIAVSPDGRQLFVTGTGATLALLTSGGQRLWVDAPGDLPFRYASDLEVTNGTIFVAGDERGLAGGTATITAIAGGDGSVRWTSDQQSTDETAFYDIAIDPSGSRIAATGDIGPWNTRDALTALFDARNGRTIWQSRYAASGDEDAGVSVVLEQGRVVVGGYTQYSGLHPATIIFAYRL